MQLASGQARAFRCFSRKFRLAGSRLQFEKKSPVVMGTLIAFADQLARDVERRRQKTRKQEKRNSL